MSSELLCHRCEYDLRAHPPDGRCPECGEPVAESLRLAPIPRRPPWQDSDPRWRRRMVAGVWVLALLPFYGLLRSVSVPTVFDTRGTVRTLGDTLLFDMNVYASLLFCIGVVLLFSKERRRRPAPLDWTRRWGVLCSYVVLLLSAAQVLFIAALVLAGIAALFLSMPPEYQPEVTQLLVNVSWVYLHYGPYPKDITGVVLVAFSSIAVLLACVPLFDALRSTGPKWVAAALLSPLVLFALMHLVHAGLYGLGVSLWGLGFSDATSLDIYLLGAYFRPELLLGYITDAGIEWFVSGSVEIAFVVEATKWAVVLAVAIWLSIAQVAAWRQGTQASTAVA